MDGGHAVSELQWIPSLGISFVSYIDGLSLLFTLLITGIGALVVLYSIFYLDKNREKLNNFYVYLLIFMSAMLGVVQSDNVISLYLFWELTSISSFLLIGYWNTRDRFTIWCIEIDDDHCIWWTNDARRICSFRYYGRYVFHP